MELPNTGEVPKFMIYVSRYVYQRQVDNLKLSLILQHKMFLESPYPGFLPDLLACLI